MVALTVQLNYWDERQIILYLCEYNISMIIYQTKDDIDVIVSPRKRLTSVSRFRLKRVLPIWAIRGHAPEMERILA